MRISFGRFLLGVLVGEGAICAIYIFAGSALLDLGKRLFGADVAEAQVAALPEGAAVYAEHCALCHEQVDERIPHRSALQQMSSARIVRALDAGAMLAIAMQMNRDERAGRRGVSRHGRAGHGGARRRVLHRPQRDARGRSAHELERLEPDARQRALSTGGARRAHGRASPAPHARVGLRVRRRRHGVRRADRHRRPRLRRQRRRSRASARCRQRLRQMDVRGQRPRAHGAARRRGRRSPASCCSAT